MVRYASKRVQRPVASFAIKTDRCGPQFLTKAFCEDMDYRLAATNWTSVMVSHIGGDVLIRAEGRNASQYNTKTTLTTSLELRKLPVLVLVVLGV